MTWDDPANNYADYYAIYRSTDKEFDEKNSKHLLTTVKRKYGLKYLDKNIEKNKTYYYKIAPVDRVHNQGEVKEKIILKK